MKKVFLVLLCIVGCQRVESEPPKPPVPVVVKDNFLYFGAEWCQPCRLMRDNTLTNARVKDAMLDRFGKYVTILDFDHSRILADAYQVEVVPTYFILRNSAIIKRGEGYASVDEFLEWLK